MESRDKGMLGGENSMSKGETQHRELSEPRRAVLIQRDVRGETSETRESQRAWRAKVGGWPWGTSGRFLAGELCSDVHVGEITLHDFPHLRIKPKTVVPITSLKRLSQRPRFVHPVVGVQVVSLTLDLSVPPEHTIPPKPSIPSASLTCY